MRLIDGDKLMDWIQDWGEKLDTSNPHDEIIDDAISAVWDKIEDMEALEWLRDPEQLPKEGECVLVTVKTDKVREGETGTFITLGCRKGESFDVLNLGGLADGVVAWMPLPEPYGGKK